MARPKKQIDVQIACQKCKLLLELYENTPQSNRDYWTMTELFVMLHDGRDYCRE